MEISLFTSQSGRPFSLSDSFIEPGLNLITRTSGSVQVERQVMLVLLFLVERADRVVTRDEILSALWSDSFSNDEALTQAVSKLRKALGDSAGESRTIQTIRKVGYRLIVPVSFDLASCDVSVPGEKQAVGQTLKRKTRNWSWVAIAIIGFVTTINALSLFAPEQNHAPRMVRVRTVIPGVDTTDVDLNLPEDLKSLSDLINGGQQSLRIVDHSGSEIKDSDIEHLIALLSDIDNLR